MSEEVSGSTTSLIMAAIAVLSAVAIRTEFFRPSQGAFVVLLGLLIVFLGAISRAILPAPRRVELDWILILAGAATLALVPVPVYRLVLARALMFAVVPIGLMGWGAWVIRRRHRAAL